MMAQLKQQTDWLVRQWQFFVFAALLLAIWLLQPMWLAFERPLIDAGQYWRLLSGQFLHLNLAHVLGNIGGLAIAWLLFAEHWRGWRFTVLTVVCVLSSNLGMWLFHPHIEYYVGFSGALYGLIAFGALSDWLHKVRFGREIFIVVLAKVAYEYFYAPLPLFSNESSLLAVEAHWFGVLAGVAAALFMHWRRAGSTCR